MRSLTGLPLLAMMLGTIATEPAGIASASASASASAADTPLARARSLEAPAPKAQTGGELEGAEFWEEHATTLTAAWRELGLRNASLGKLQDGFVALRLEAAVAAARAAPSAETEAAVRALWTKAAPGVWTADLLVPSVIAELRAELERIRDSGIPTRRPNGMNRYGVILDTEVGVPTLDGLISELVARYTRPIAAMLFPEHLVHTDTVESFVFTVRYKDGEDVSLAEHRDASVATLNLNLNTPADGDDYGGSDLYFVDEKDPEVRHTVSFAPGMAVLHTGSLRHAAMPIQRGERQNLIVWLFGQNSEVRIAPYDEAGQMSVEERWWGAVGR